MFKNLLNVEKLMETFVNKSNDKQKPQLAKFYSVGDIDIKSTRNYIQNSTFLRFYCFNYLIYRRKQKGFFPI